MNKKIIWGVVVIVIVIVGGYYLLAKRYVLNCCHGEQYNNWVDPNATDWKTFTSKNGYSFTYPAKTFLSESQDEVTLSHSIPFENRDGGCDMIGDSVLSPTLTDFNLSIKVVSGEVKPAYIDGDYSAGNLKGKYAYMGAEGCGKTMYYFPIEGNKTLVVTKAEVQILSAVVLPEVRAKVLAVHGVISQDEAKSIMNRILSSFELTSYSINNEAFILSPKENERVKAGSTYTIRWNEVEPNNLLFILNVGNIQKSIPAQSISTNIIPNTLSLIWKVPLTFDELGSTPVNKDYSAFITVHDARNNQIIGRSKNFTITK